MRPVTADSSRLGLPLSRCKQVLHIVRLLQQLSEQAGPAAATDNGNTPMLLSQPQRDRYSRSPTRGEPPTNNCSTGSGTRLATPGIPAISNYRR